jgi:hypothetical protein
VASELETVFATPIAYDCALLISCSSNLYLSHTIFTRDEKRKMPESIMASFRLTGLD